MVSEPTTIHLPRVGRYAGRAQLVPELVENSAVKRVRAGAILGWVTSREVIARLPQRFPLKTPHSRITAVAKNISNGLSFPNTEAFSAQLVPELAESSAVKHARGSNPGMGDHPRSYCWITAAIPVENPTLPDNRSG
uniref:Iron-hydroxamate transporter ATP-binding subunit n=1 Tax=Papaver somniferum TaxID=3469 RepID=A0A5B7LK66_PAPSO|nr:iron-hydroxamate transporter ATP-binding subunit [Papaver somniferum]